MSVAAYPEYQNCGVEGLGRVPSHWTLRRLRFAATLNPTKSEIAHLDRDTELSFLPMDAVGEDGSLRLDELRPVGAVETGYTFFREGDVAFAKITPCFENGKGAIMRGLVGGFGFGTTELTVLRPLPGIASAEFLNWIICSPQFRAFGEGSMYGAGGQKRVPDDFARNFVAGFPSVPEQTAIASFLNRETGKIDALVEEQRRLIAQLKEKRQAVTSQAVTKGLDPNAPMKDSGVEWLGEVPAHWEVAPLKWLTPPDRAIMYGIVLPGPNVGKGVPIVKGGDVKPRRLSLDQLCWTTSEIEAPFARARLRPNDIVYSIRGSIGDAELVPDELTDANITQDVARISPVDDVNFRWLLSVMRSQPIFVQLEQRSMGAAVRGINIFDLKRAQIPVPPRAEQDAIAAFLYDQLGKLSELRAEAEAATKLLQERRAALISAAVTGKIDVRGMVSIEAVAA